MLKFIGEPWCDVVLKADEIQKSRSQRIREYGTPEVHQPIFRRSIGRWQRDLSPRDVACIDRIGGGLLESLGYDRSLKSLR